MHYNLRVFVRKLSTQTKTQQMHQQAQGGRARAQMICGFLLILITTACVNVAPLPDIATPDASVSSTPLATVDTRSPTPTLLAFVQAVNQQDYDAAFGLLDEASRQRIQVADSVRQAYTSAQQTATAQAVTYTLRGGLLQQDNRAIATLVSTWQTTLLGTFDLTATLTLSAEAQGWRVLWSRDLIVPGMARGQLALKRDTPTRGDINAADGSPLAAQSEGVTIGVRRSGIKDAADEQAMLSLLSQLTKLRPADIQARYKDKPPNWFVPIARINEETLTQNSDLIAPFDAISARPNYVRTYPQGTLAPHVVGYVGSISAETQATYIANGYAGDEQVGLSGVEGAMEETLAGVQGGALQIVAADGSVTVIAKKAFVPSKDITLSISPTLQMNVQKLLGNRRGAVVVMKPQDGSILAMASYPTYNTAVFEPTANPQERVQLISDPAKPLLNRATQGLYPAGSTFKMVTMAAGISEGVTQPDDVFSDPGSWDGLGSTYRKTCWLRSGHGRLTLTQGLSASCDVVFYNVGKRLTDKSPEVLSRYGKQFGFGAPTGVELSGEGGGLMPDPEWKKDNIGEVWTSGDTVNLSIGQGFMLATPLQIAQMTAAIANGGTLIQPHVVASVTGYEGQTSLVQPIEPIVVRKLPISDSGLQAIQKGMVGVTTDARIGTTYYRFRDFDYYQVDGRVVAGGSLNAKQRAAATRFIVAGKSGTAQAPGATEKPFAWFTAYTPADNPQIVVTALLENIGEGSGFAAPLVRQVIEAYYGLPISGTPGNAQNND
jgi:penicillin-binding protein 2